MDKNKTNISIDRRRIAMGKVKKGVESANISMIVLMTIEKWDFAMLRACCKTTTESIIECEQVRTREGESKQTSCEARKHTNTSTRRTNKI